MPKMQVFSATMFENIAKFGKLMNYSQSLIVKERNCFNILKIFHFVAWIAFVGRLYF